MANANVEGTGGNGAKRPGGLTATSVLLALKRRPITLLGVVVLAAAAGSAVWFLLPLPKATAAVVFHVAPQRPSLFDTTGGGGDGGSYRQSQVTLVKRRLMLNTVLKQPGVQQLDVVRRQPNAVAWLENNLKVEARTNTDFLQVSLEGDNPEDLRVLLDALAKVYLADVDERDNGARREKLRRLEDQNRTYEADVKLSHKRIDTIALALGSKDGPTLAVTDSLLRDELRDAKRELDEAKRNRFLAEAELGISDQNANIDEPAGPEQLVPRNAPNAKPAVVTVTPAEIENELRQDPVLRELESEVVRTRQVLTDTQARFQDGARPPAVVEADEKLKAAIQKRDKYRAVRQPEIEEILRKRNEERDQIRLASVATTLGSLKRREELAKSKVAEIDQSIKKYNEYKIELERLKSSISQTERLSSSLSETIERMKVDLGAGPRVTIADESHVISGLEGNRRMKFTLLAALAVLGLGFVTVVGWEHRSRRITHADEVTSVLGARLIGSVPTLAQDPMEAEAAHPVLVEAIDATRTMLVHGTDQPGLRVLVVTSAVSGEGKTSLSGHLAISLARAGFRTLLIDGDLRAPTAQRLFDVPLAPGLCETLEGRVGVADAIRPTGVPGLFILTAGEYSAATRQALVGDRWQVTKEQLKAEFDYVVVDTSPLLLVNDATLLAREADGVVVSVLLGVSQVALVEDAIARLQTVRAKIVGVIANGARNAAHQYTHGYRAKRAIEASKDTAASGR